MIVIIKRIKVLINLLFVIKKEEKKPQAFLALVTSSMW